MQNDSANAGATATETPAELAAEPTSVDATSADTASDDVTSGDATSADATSADAMSGAETEPAAEVPQPRAVEPEPGGSKGKKRKAAPKSKSAAGTKALVVFREGKVHYADESVVVLDLDEAAHPDTDVHDVVDKLSELRDAAESPGRTEAVTLVAELIQSKALA